ncbi:putative phage tail assembly chaperone [Thalassotalea sp. 1_MG-2023]|uniref:putative phage tail assembly chaperone n=1 Tax=Thalassotalea sp. 1_MG-2023 TaxID=3062680 RepID=UPI0026E31868|nr:putative phage tail assembly chaperone [Thalassotalea sp. 1_MG-2023]MDO6426237.1 putative phage tail assembly chaperone [Thalassotalea sp. 1_MG-2023]
MAFEKKITLTVNGEDMVFNVNVAAYNKYINDTTPKDKVKPAFNFITAIVDPKSREAAIEFMKKPGGALHLLGAIVEEYQEDFDITVKK